MDWDAHPKHGPEIETFDWNKVGKTDRTLLACVSLTAELRGLTGSDLHYRENPPSIRNAIQIDKMVPFVKVLRNWPPGPRSPASSFCRAELCNLHSAKLPLASDSTSWH